MYFLRKLREHLTSWSTARAAAQEFKNEQLATKRSEIETLKTAVFDLTHAFNRATSDHQQAISYHACLIIEHHRNWDMDDILLAKLDDTNTISSKITAAIADVEKDHPSDLERIQDLEDELMKYPPVHHEVCDEVQADDRLRELSLEKIAEQYRSVTSTGLKKSIVGSQLEKKMTELLAAKNDYTTLQKS